MRAFTSWFRRQGSRIATVTLATVMLLGACAPAQQTPPAASQAKMPSVTITVFQPPSLGAFLPPVIKAKGFDAQNNLNLEFVEKPAGTYNTDFAAGTDKVGGSAGLLSEALRVNKGVKVSYLFNLFDYWGTVVTAQPEIRSLTDLEGRTLAADKASTNYAMFTFFARKAGVNLERVTIQTASGPALVTTAQAERADAVQLWEPAYTQLARGTPGKFHQLSYVEKWPEYTGGQQAIPYLGVAAHEDWITQNKDLIPRLYTTYKAAAEFTRANPAEAARIIGEKTKIAPADLEELIGDPRLGLNVYPASQQRESINTVFEAGIDVRYLDRVPDKSIVYEGLE